MPIGMPTAGVDDRLSRKRRKRPARAPRSAPTPSALGDLLGKSVARGTRHVRGAAAEVLADAGFQSEARGVPTNIFDRYDRLQTAYNLTQTLPDPLKTAAERQRETRLRNRLDNLGKRIDTATAELGPWATESNVPGIVERGPIGSLVYELTGEDISDDVRTLTYGTPNPSAGQVAIALGAGPILKGAGLALRGAKAGTAALGATRAASAARAASTGARAATTGRAAARLAESQGGRVALGVGRAAKGTAKVAGKTATFPIRRPIKTAKYSFAAQAPLAISTGDPMGELQKVLHGQGVAANVLGDIAKPVIDAAPGEIAENIVKDVFDLPAQIVPSIYMPLAGIVEAAQGDSSRLEGLFEDYKQSGLIPAVLEGDFKKALENVKAHPLFLALEARGGQAVVGRAAGAATRRAGWKIGDQTRAPLERPTGLAPYPRNYSPDLIEKGVQVLADRRREKRFGGQRVPVEGGIIRDRIHNEKKFLREGVDRRVAAEEGLRRSNRAEESTAAVATLASGSRIPFRRKISKVDRSGVNLVTQGFVRNPKTFEFDLGSQLKSLDDTYARMKADRDAAPSKQERVPLEARMEANRDLAKRVDKLLREGDPEAIFAAARENVKGSHVIDDELISLGLLDPRQAVQARSMPAAMRHLDARYDISNQTTAKIAEIKERLARTDNVTEEASLRGSLGALSQRRQLVDRDGNALPPERVEAALSEVGAEPAAFVSQSPSARGAGSFYKGFFPDRQTIPGPARTGKATQEGTFDASFDALVEQRIRGRGIIDATKGFDRTVREFAVGGRTFKSSAEAREAARHPEAFDLPEGVDLVPVRLAPLRATVRETERAEELFRELDPTDQLGTESFLERLLTKSLEDGEGPTVLLPQTAVRRLNEHLAAAGTLRRAAQVFSSQFKGVVLPTSVNWLAGNFLDVNMRTAMSGTSPYGFNKALGKKIDRMWDEVGTADQAAEARARLVPGTAYGAADASRVYRDARQFVDSSLAPFARAIGAVRRAPGVKTVVNAYVKYRDGVFALNTKYLENNANYAMLGKVARSEVRATTGKWHKGLKMGDEAIRDFAKGSLKTPNQIKYAKSMEDTLGQWTANSPSTRTFLVDYAPFAMWTRAASKFVLMTLPAKHPIKTALAAIAYEMTETEREALGLSLFVENRLPDNLQGSIPTGDGGLYAPQTLTSFGYFADIQQSLSSSILPQVPIPELAGIDFTGDRLTNEDGTPLNAGQRALVVMGSVAEASVPFLAQGQRIAEKGPEGVLPSAFKEMDPGLVEWLREQSGNRQIGVPATPSSSGSSGGPDWGSFGGGASSGPDWGSFGG